MLILNDSMGVKGSEFMDSRPNLINWQELQKSLMNQMQLTKGFNNPEIEKFVNRALKNALQDWMPNFTNPYPFSSDDIDYELFETQKTVFVRFTVSDKLFKDELRLFASTKKLKIEYSGNTKEINLPSDVNPVSGNARKDGNVIEIRLPKKRSSEPYHEIFLEK